MLTQFLVMYILQKIIIKNNREACIACQLLTSFQDVIYQLSNKKINTIQLSVIFILPSCRKKLSTSTENLKLYNKYNIILNYHNSNIPKKNNNIVVGNISFFILIYSYNRVLRRSLYLIPDIAQLLLVITQLSKSNKYATIIIENVGFSLKQIQLNNG